MPWLGLLDHGAGKLVLAIEIHQFTELANEGFFGERTLEVSQRRESETYIQIQVPLHQYFGGTCTV